MLIALDINGNRIQASKGELGKCQICGNDVRAYCGEINIHHWRHVDLSKCDFWKENETEWHRGWKEHFPVEWQEVVINKEGQTHRADIKTNTGLVVEFQNSSISSSEIKQRERFYENMIWLINAKEIKDNFQLWSLVKTQLKYLETNYSSYYNLLGNESDSHEVRNKKEIISDIKDDISSNKYKIERLNNSIQVIKDLKKSLNATTKDFIRSYHGYFSPMRDFNCNLKELYLEAEEEIRGLGTQLENKDFLLNKIETFEKCKISGLENYRIVDYKYINSKHYQICKLVKKENFNSLFPEVIGFNSESDFSRTSKSQNHILIMNFTTIKTKLENEKKKLQLDTDNLKDLRRKHKKNLKKEIKSFLNSRLKKENKSLSKIRKFDVDLKEQLYDEERELLKIKNQEKAENAENYSKTLREEEQRKFQIMRKYKGFYGYNWKYRRKSWDFSKCPLYLDFGNSIFHIQNESTLKKMTYEEFINFVKKDNI